jgi:hypothetical protein
MSKHKPSATVKVAAVVSPEQTRKDAGKARRAAKRAAYPVIVVSLKLHKAAQSRDVLAKMFATAQEWANGNKYVVTTADPITQKSGAIAHSLMIDTPESYAAKLHVSDSSVAKAFATALRNPEVQAKAAALKIAPKQLVLDAMRKQFGITIEL